MYEGKIYVWGRARRISDGTEVDGGGEFSANDQYVAMEFSKSLPYGVGRAIDGAVNLYTETYAIDKDKDKNRW